MPLPTVSIIVPTYNERHHIGACLGSLLTQSYDQRLLEIVVVDNDSTDGTAALVAALGAVNPSVRLLSNTRVKDAEVSKMIGFENSTGELFIYLDADITVSGADWLINLVRPLCDDPAIAGSFGRFASHPSDRPLGRYLGFHPLQLDPLLQFLCTEVKETVVEHRSGYQVCRFDYGRTPPVGVCLYRREVLTRCLGKPERFMDVDVPVILSEMGYDMFAFVPLARMHHVHAESVVQLIRKRLRSLTKTYIPHIETRRFTYLRWSNKRDVLKVVLWTLYANLILPKLIKGVLLSLRHRDLAGLYEPVVSVAVTDAVVLGFLCNRAGRRVVRGQRPARLRRRTGGVGSASADWLFALATAHSCSQSAPRGARTPLAAWPRHKSVLH